MLQHYGTILCLEKAPLGGWWEDALRHLLRLRGGESWSLELHWYWWMADFHVNNWQISGDACSWRIQLWQTGHPLKRAVSGFAFREGHAWSWQRYAALKNVGNVGGFWESSNLKRPPLWIPFSIYPLRGTSRGFGFISYDTFEASDAALAGMNGCGATAALLFLFYRHVINLLIQFKFITI